MLRVKMLAQNSGTGERLFLAVLVNPTDVVMLSEVQSWMPGHSWGVRSELLVRGAPKSFPIAETLEEIAAQSGPVP